MVLEEVARNFVSFMHSLCLTLQYIIPVVWTYTMWRRCLWIRRLRTLRISAVLAVVSLFMLALQYIHQILVRTLWHKENMDAINAAIFTLTLQSIFDLTINTTISARSSVTPWPDSSDIFISVKTTSSNHVSRLSLLLTTWMQIVEAKQVRIC